MTLSGTTQIKETIQTKTKDTSLSKSFEKSTEKSTDNLTVSDKNLKKINYQNTRMDSLLTTKHKKKSHKK